jgi:DNA polymerase alpha subunit A
MPSVQVALRLIAKGKHVKAKDVMSFIITGNSNGSAEAAAKNAYPQDEVMKPDSELKPDIDYYLHKQILPPVERLCAPISGTDVTQLADCLGLDTSKYRVSSVGNGVSQDHEIQPLESQIPDAVRFKDASPLTLHCRSCRAASVFRGVVPPQPGSPEESITQAAVTHEGLTCPNESCKTVIANLSVAAQLEAQIRQHIARYYSAWLICDDPSCGLRTKQMSVYGHRCLGPKGTGLGCLGRMHFEYTEKMLYNQLLYLAKMFDVDKAKRDIEKMSTAGAAGGMEKVKVLVEVNRERFGTLEGVVKGYLEKNGRQWVQMDSLFAFALKMQI